MRNRMGARILTQLEVRRLLPMSACIELMSQALMALGRGEAINPLRDLVRLPDGRGILGMMPGHLGSPEALGLKVVTVFPHNHGTPYDTHQGVVLLLDPRHGMPLAVMDASEVTAIRTAAVSGVATRLLAREEAADLAILGSGVQARTHLEAMLLTRKLRRLRVFGHFGPHRGWRPRRLHCSRLGKALKQRPPGHIANQAWPFGGKPSSSYAFRRPIVTYKE